MQFDVHELIPSNFLQKMIAGILLKVSQTQRVYHSLEDKERKAILPKKYSELQKM